MAVYNCFCLNCREDHITKEISSFVGQGFATGTGVLIAFKRSIFEPAQLVYHGTTKAADAVKVLKGLIVNDL